MLQIKYKYQGPFMLFGLVVLLSITNPAGQKVSVGQNAKKIEWSFLRQLNYKKGTMTEELQMTVGTAIQLPGYVVPLDGDENEFSTFLLVPIMGACVHLPPPPPNQTVLVKMNQPVPIDIVFDPVLVTGRLLVKNSRHDLGWDTKASYEIAGTSTEPYTDWDDGVH